MCVLSAKGVSCPCLLFNSLLALSIPRGDTENACILGTGILKTRGYPKCCDCGISISCAQTSTKLFIITQKRKEFEDSKPKYRTMENNTLFDDLTYNMSEHCGNCSCFSSSLLGEITCNSQISPRVTCQSIELGACLWPIICKHERDL